MRRVLPILLLGLAVSARASERVSVEFDVEVPADTTGTVYVALDEPVNGKPAWTPDAVALAKDERGHWRGQASVLGPEVAFKITRGSWATVEKGPRGEELGNRTVSGPGAATVKVARWADHVAPADAGVAPVSTSLVDLGVLRPAKLEHGRRVVVWVPPGYDAKRNRDVRYPVLYVLDGQNQFDPKRSFLGITWRLDQAATEHVAAGRQPFIAVAIDNSPARADEYLPSVDRSRGGGGKLEDFAHFVFQELKPKIDEQFRTKPGPDDTGVLGSSFGGMAAFHLGWKHPDVVRRIGSVSPSLWWNKEETRLLVNESKDRPPIRLWLDMGTAEGKDEASSKPYVKAARGVRDALLARGFVPGKDLAYEEVTGAPHNEAAWAQRLPRILAFLFP